MEIKSVIEFKKAIEGNKVKSPILIYGDEKYLINECIKQVKGKINSFPELNILTLEGESITMDNIINACETIPFMSKYKLMHIKNPDFIKKSGKGSSNNEKPEGETHSNSGIAEELTNYLVSLTEDIIVLITMEGEIEAKNKLTMFSKNTGTLVQLNELKGAELQKYVEEMFKGKGKGINKTELIYFISEVGNSLTQIEGEIDKLCMYNTEEAVIKKSDIDAIVTKTAESNIFRMVDNISKKDAAKAVSILNTLLFQREEHLKILAMIIRQYRLLLTIKLNLINKTPFEQIKSQLRLNEFVLNNMIKQCGAYSEEALKKALGYCLNTDSQIKNSRMNPDYALELLIVELCK